MKKVREGYKMTEIGEIPEDWELEELINITDFINGMAFKPTDWETEGFPIIRIQNLNGSEEYNYCNKKVDDKYYVENGDLLFSWSGSRGTSFGPHIWKGQKGVLNQHIFKLKFKKEIEKYYFYYALKRITEIIEKDAHGSAGLVHITKGSLGKFKVPIPPLTEQKKIASILSTVDESIEKTDEIIEKTKELKKGLMQKLLTKGIGHSKFKMTEIGEIPEEWEVDKLENLTLKITDGSHSSPMPVKESKYKICTVANMGESKLDTQNCASITKEDFEKLVSLSCKPQYGDVLLSKDGTIGKTIVFKQEDENIVLLSSIAIIRPNPSVLDSTYLKHFFSAPVILEKMMGMKTGSAIRRIVLRDIKAIVVKIPPLQEQRQIASILSAVDEKIEAEEKRKEQLLQLKKGLMQQLLTGRIRVKV